MENIAATPNLALGEHDGSPDYAALKLRFNPFEMDVWEGSRPAEWWMIPEMRIYFTYAHRLLKMDAAIAVMSREFGDAIVPSRTALNRYWLRLDALLGCPARHYKAEPLQSLRETVAACGEPARMAIAIQIIATTTDPSCCQQLRRAARLGFDVADELENDQRLREAG